MYWKSIAKYLCFPWLKKKSCGLLNTLGPKCKFLKQSFIRQDNPHQRNVIVCMQEVIFGGSALFWEISALPWAHFESHSLKWWKHQYRSSEYRRQQTSETCNTGKISHRKRRSWSKGEFKNVTNYQNFCKEVKATLTQSLEQAECVSQATQQLGKWSYFSKPFFFLQ